jgi:aryl-alcohol dehydrogenase-like predicted oxidoreductase
MSLPHYYTLGRSGLRVSRLALGTMTFGTEWGWGADKAAARALFDRYVEAGGNFIDTADVYTQGTSEAWLGEFIAERGLRDKLVLATKFSHPVDPGNPNGCGNGRMHIVRALEASLARLRTDHVDLYFLHTWDQVTPVDEVMRTLDDLVRAGKVRHVGLSDVPAWYASRGQALAECRSWEPVCALQLEYSLVERQVEFEFTRLATDHGMGIVAWSPLASGLLSGKYRPGDAPAAMAEGRLKANVGRSNPIFDRLTERNWSIVAELEKVAREAGRSMAQVAIQWVANRPGVGAVILGATRLDQLDDTLASLDVDLPPDAMSRLDAASAPAPRFPYTLFTPEFQRTLHGGARVGDKPAGYRPGIVIPGRRPSSG